MNADEIAHLAAKKAHAPLREVDPERLRAVREERQKAIDASFAALRQAFPERERPTRQKAAKVTTGGWS